MNAALELQPIADRAAATVRAAIENQHLDRELVTRAFAGQLEALKLPARPVIFYPNLNEALKRVNELAVSKIERDAAWDAAWAAAWAAARAAAWAAARAAAWAAAWAAARDAAWDAARDAAWAAARDAAWAAARDAAWAAASQGSRPDSAAPPDTPYDIATRAFLDILRGGAFIYWIAPDAVHVVLATIRIQPTTSRVVLTPMLGQIEQRVSRLHCEDAPAIQYEDGSGLYYWRGIQVPAHVILEPQHLRVNMILAERNAEVRRAMIERYGQDRFVLDAGARCLDKWKGNELLSIDLPEDPDQRLVALKLRCPSTSAVYIIRVPPDQRSVQGALAWSFGLDRASDYVLQQES